MPSTMSSKDISKKRIERVPGCAVDMSENLSYPLLGLFGADDQQPAPEHVKRMEEELKRFNETYAFHMYENAGHAFF